MKLLSEVAPCLLVIQTQIQAVCDEWRCIFLMEFENAGNKYAVLHVFT